MKRNSNQMMGFLALITLFALALSACGAEPKDANASSNARILLATSTVAPYEGPATQASEPTTMQVQATQTTAATAIAQATATQAPTSTPAPKPTNTLAPTTVPTAEPTATKSTNLAVGQVFDYTTAQLEPIRGAVNFPPLMPAGFVLQEGVTPPFVVAQNGQTCGYNEAFYVLEGQPLGVAPGTYTVACGKYALDPHTSWTGKVFIGGWVYNESKLNGLVYHSTYDGMMYNEATPGRNMPEGIALWGPSMGLTMTVDYGTDFNTNNMVMSGKSAELVPWTVFTLTIVNDGDTRAYFGKGPWGKASGNGVNPPEVQPNWEALAKYYELNKLVLPVRGGNGEVDTAFYPGYAEGITAHNANALVPLHAANGDTCYNVPQFVTGKPLDQADGVSVLSCYWGAELAPKAEYSATIRYQSAVVKSPTLDAIRVLDVIQAMIYDWTAGTALEGLMIESSVPMEVSYEYSDGTISKVCTGNSFEVVNDVLIYWHVINPSKTTPAHLEQRAWGGQRGSQPTCMVDPTLAVETFNAVESTMANQPEGAASVITELVP